MNKNMAKIFLNKTHRNARKGQSGLTLIEIMISVVVLAITLVGVLGVLASTLKATEVYNNYDASTASATYLLAQIQTYAYGNYDATYSQFNGKTYYAASVPHLSAIDQNSGTPYAKVYIDNSNPSLLSATAEVYWNDLGGAETYTQQTTITQSN